MHQTSRTSKYMKSRRTNASNKTPLCNVERVDTTIPVILTADERKFNLKEENRNSLYDLD